MRRRQIFFSFASDNHAAAADEQQTDAAHGATEAPHVEILVAGAPAPKAPPAVPPLSAVPNAEQPLPMTASDACHCRGLSRGSSSSPALEQTGLRNAEAIGDFGSGFSGPGNVAIGYSPCLTKSRSEQNVY